MSQQEKRSLKEITEKDIKKQIFVKILLHEFITIFIGVFLVWIYENQKVIPAGESPTEFKIIFLQTLPWSLLAGFFITFILEIQKFSEIHKKETCAAINEALSNKDLVLKTDITDFEPKYIKMVQDIIYYIKKTNEIYALDSSPPSQWWSNSMLGYLVVQVNWVSNELDKKLHRFFVMSESDITSPQGIKILILQILMGVNVYIMTPKKYESLLKKYKQSNPNSIIKNKEFFTWDKCDSIYAEVHEFQNHFVRGYQSIWPVGTPYTERGEKKFTDIKGGQRNPNDYSDYKVEFITDTTVDHAKDYRCFAQFLIKNTALCIKENDARNASIIKIPAVVSSQRPLHIETIKNIILTFCESRE